MQNRLVKGITALLIATGMLATTAFAAPPKLQFQYLAFPETCVEGSIGSFQLLMVNNGATGSVAGTDHVLVTIPFGNQPDDFLGNTTGLTCGAQSPLWNCAVQAITVDTVTISLYPTSGTVPVKTGETLYFYLDSAQVNAVSGMAMLDVTQNIDPGRASNPQNTQMSILKVSAFAAAYMEIDPTVVPSVKDGVDWTELSGIPAGFADGVDNTGLAAESDPTVPANIKDGIAWNEISGIPAGFADGVDNTGVTTESDPTVPANLKDGIAWSEISGIPTSLLDGDQVGIASESDPQVGSNTTNRVPKWDGNALVSSNAINENVSGNVGIGTASPQSKLDVAGDTNVSGVLTSGKIQVVDVVTEGSSCTPNGLIARATNGLILSCQSGTWQKASGSVGGLSGYELKSASTIAPGNILTSFSISCTDGKKVIGGGCSDVTGGLRYLRYSYPSNDHTWTCASHDEAVASMGTLTAYIICVNQ